MKRSISSLLLLSILLSMFCGCQSNSQDSNMTKETDTTSASTEGNPLGTSSANSAEPFEEYAINITTDLLCLYKEPNYEAETVGILEKGEYIVVDEVLNSFGDVPLCWVKLKDYDGWVILNYINDDYVGEDWNENSLITDSSTITLETGTNFKSYKVEVLNDCLSVYSEPKLSLNLWLYDITDHRTITIIEEQDAWHLVDYRTWAKLESGGWVRLDSITDTANNTKDTTNTKTEKTDTSFIDDEDEDETDTTTKAPVTEVKTQLEGIHISNNRAYEHIYGCGEKHTSIVNGKTFIWYDRYESRNKDNTCVYSSIDLISFDVEYTFRHDDAELLGWTKDWMFNFEIQSSDDMSFLLYWNAYDKDDYLIKEILTGSISGDSHIKGNKDNIAKGFYLIE